MPIRHHQVAPLLAWQQQEFGLGPHVRLAPALSVAFDFGLQELLSVLLFGGTLVFLEPGQRRQPGAYAELVCRQGVNTLFGTPAWFEQLLALGRPLPSVRLALVGGEALARATAEALLRLLGRGCAAYNGYGPTEAAINCAMFRFGPEGLTGLPGPGVPIGSPSGNSELYVLDGNLEPVPVGVVAELCIGGPGLADGYWARPTLTAERFVPHPFANGSRLYRSGDAARWRPDGTLEFCGRLDRQVKVRGQRAEPGEIEVRLRAHPDVAEAAVTARPGPGGQVELAAYLVPRPGAQAPGAAELRRYLRAQVPEALVPGSFTTLAALPRGPSGKVEHRALPEPERVRPELAQPYLAPGSQAERLVAQAWAEALQLDRVGRDDNFFDLGGHSLLAVQVVQALRERFQIDLPLHVIFDLPTVAGLASHIENVAPAGAEWPISERK